MGGRRRRRRREGRREVAADDVGGVRAELEVVAFQRVGVADEVAGGVPAEAVFVFGPDVGVDEADGWIAAGTIPGGSGAKEVGEGGCSETVGAVGGEEGERLDVEGLFVGGAVVGDDGLQTAYDSADDLGNRICPGYDTRELGGKGGVVEGLGVGDG